VTVTKVMERSTVFLPSECCLVGLDGCEVCRRCYCRLNAALWVLLVVRCVDGVTAV